MRLSGIFDSELRDAACRHTWPYNHVLEYRPLETVQRLERTPARVSYLDRIHEVWLELAGRLVMTQLGEKTK